MGRLLTKKLLESGTGKYVIQMGFTWQEVKALRDLVHGEINRQRKNKHKETNYQALDNIIPLLYEAEKYLRYAYDKRQEGRYKAKLKVTDLASTNLDTTTEPLKSAPKSTNDKIGGEQ